MCNHRYSGNYEHWGATIGVRCPYPAFFEKMALPLPTDGMGACIFHSGDVAWKRANDFAGRFRGLLALLGADEEVRNGDFAEFVFVGDAPEQPSGQAVIRMPDIVFRRPARFVAASFIDPLILDDVRFDSDANFSQAVFSQGLTFSRTSIRGADFSGARLEQRAFFSDVEFRDFALFNDARFTGAATGTVVKFERSSFEGITDFSGAAFALGTESSVGFWQVRFQDVVSFRETRFNCHLEFDDVVFEYTAEFIDTVFDSVGSSARYRGAAVELNRITVGKDAVVRFVSTDPANKLFHHDVQMSFKEEPSGTIHFENVDFSKISSTTRLRLMDLSRTGRVEIGSGCIKYRHQTPVRTISMSEGNQPLVIELCQTFTNYFSQSNGLNLGFEVVERSAMRIAFFYFTDENIPESEFLGRLAQTERRLWGFLSVRSDRELLTVADSPAVARTQNYVINAIDGISAMMGTFFRVGARLLMGAWTEADTYALLTAIRFNDADAADRAAILHQVIVDKYTSRRLLGINRQQHNLLQPMDDSHDSSGGKIRILFLAANPRDEEDLDLAQNASRIKQALRVAPERASLEFHQESAVTIDSLMVAMLETRPTIVHFAGHGSPEGIVVEDGGGSGQLVSTDALAQLFGRFVGSLACVVLSSCYSEHQARAIHSKIPYVIGIKGRIPDYAAIAFSTGFYQAIGARQDIPAAFNLGIDRIRLEGAVGADALLLLQPDAKNAVTTI